MPAPAPCATASVASGAEGRAYKPETWTSPTTTVTGISGTGDSGTCMSLLRDHLQPCVILRPQDYALFDAHGLVGEKVHGLRPETGQCLGGNYLRAVTEVGEGEDPGSVPGPLVAQHARVVGSERNQARSGQLRCGGPHRGHLPQPGEDRPLRGGRVIPVGV